jgi:carbon storage regulator
MLILSRKLGEQIVIDGNILLRIVAVSGNRVKLGITAPASVVVEREELCRRPPNAGPFLKGPAAPEGHDR